MPRLVRRDHLPAEQAAAVDHAPQVDPQQALPFRGRGVEHRSGHADAGIADYHIRDSEGVAHPLGEGLHGLGIADVDLVDMGRGAKGAGQFGAAFGGFQIEIGGEQAGAALGEAEQGRTADAAAGAGDHHQLAAHRARVGPDLGALQGRRRLAGFLGVDELAEPAGQLLRLGQQLPMADARLAPPQAWRPQAEVLEQLGADVTVAGRYDQLHRHFGVALARTEQAADEVAAVQLDPVPAVAGLGRVDLRMADAFGVLQELRPEPGQAGAPEQLGYDGGMEEGDVPEWSNWPNTAFRAFGLCCLRCSRIQKPTWSRQGPEIEV